MNNQVIGCVVTVCFHFVLPLLVIICDRIRYRKYYNDKIKTYD